MKSFFLKPLFTAFFITSFGSAYAQLSTSALDSRAIHPFGSTFSPFQKFAAIGESGGTPGPTVTGCDIYGYRAQLALDNAVNIGIQSYTFGANNTPASAAVISTSSNKALYIVEENTLPTTFNFGCGNLLGVFKQSSTNNNVFNVIGSATATGGTWTTSDRTLKRNIEPIENALEIVSQLQGYTYEYRRKERPELNLPKGQRYGFITQEVQEVMPTVVRKSTDIQGNPADYQVMEYDAIIPVLAEAIKMQQEEIIELEQENTTLEARIARLEALVLKGNNTNKALDNTVNNMQGVTLGQNRPNPSSTATVIGYSLPQEMNNASLVVFDLKGQTLSSQEIGAGEGSVELNTSNLPAGVYIYSIVVDGKSLAREKMTVQ
ncbi:MAG: tail fiber domain-containing protein [Aureispira sp.]